VAAKTWLEHVASGCGCMRGLVWPLNQKQLIAILFTGCYPGHDYVRDVLYFEPLQYFYACSRKITLSHFSFPITYLEKQYKRSRKARFHH
jgi:hypothetical protein